MNQDLFQYLCIHFCVINTAFGFIFSYILHPRVWKISDVMASLSLSPARRWAGRLRISGLQASLGISFCLKHLCKRRENGAELILNILMIVINAVL